MSSPSPQRSYTKVITWYGSGIPVAENPTECATSWETAGDCEGFLVGGPAGVRNGAVCLVVVERVAVLGGSRGGPAGLLTLPIFGRVVKGS